MGDTGSERQLRQLPDRRAKPSRWIPAEGRRVPIESRWTASTDVRRGSMSNTVDISLDSVLSTENRHTESAWIHSTVGARGLKPAGLNRRMRKTACPVVWEG